MTLHLPLLLAYAAVLVGVGLWVGRRVQSADGFFVAGRGLGPGLLFATLIAANIGAGSTVGAAGLGYRDGLAGWWWVGAAGFGSLVQAFWIGPRMRRVAEEHRLRTVGDYLEFRFGPRVRVVTSVLLWVGTVAILAGQLIAMSTLFSAMIGSPKWVGCLLGGVVVTAYFTAGGLLSSAWVNVVQVVVKFAGFALAFPVALAALGGWEGFRAALPADPGYVDPWRNGASGWMYLALLGPAFIVSPGLLQKIFGARDDRTVRIGVGLNALVLLGFAAVPVLMGMMARVSHPALASPQLALPTLLVHDVPVGIGALGLAALFSAEVSSADAILFMLATSLSQDLYKRTLRPSATDAQVLRVARFAAVAGGGLGIAIALAADTIVGTLSFFYSVLGVCLFVPIVGGLTVRRVDTRATLWAIVGGIVVMLGLRLGAGEAWHGLTPAMVGLATALLAAAGSVALGPARAGSR
ncbi:MAG: sodium:solute symporter family protein [Gemmatimonadaceae bacterium]|nr:sodium:solute symporter family protein [Gemmatimonadaceae bacterium]